MKKTIIFLAIVMILLMTVGCDMKNMSAYPESQSAEIALFNKVNDANCAVWNSELEDPVAFNKTMELVAGVVDRDVDYSVTFFYHDIDNSRVVTMPTLVDRRRFMNNNEYRKLLKAGLQERALSDIRNEAYGLSEHGEIVATIVSWEHYDAWGNKTPFYVCDFDADGTWDYGSKDSFLWLYGNINAGDIGRNIDEYNELAIDCDNLITLPELEGNETFCKLEKLLN